MELTNEFTVEVPVDEAWEVLTDLQRIAPCMPGAELRDVEGEDYHGVVKVKVGPITAEYKGKVTFVERDDGAHRAVLRAQGREVRGQGHANATITATLAEVDASTRVSVVTDLNITGKVAQLGRGVLADVSSKLMSEFADSLEASLWPATPAEGDGAQGGGPEKTSEDAAGTNGSVPVATSAAVGEQPPVREVREVREVPEVPEVREVREVREVPRPSSAPAAAAPVDLVRVAAPSVAKRAAPVILGLVALWLVTRRRRRAHS
jgi:uncharacterized protein